MVTFMVFLVNRLSKSWEQTDIVNKYYLKINWKIQFENLRRMYGDLIWRSKLNPNEEKQNQT